MTPLSRATWSWICTILLLSTVARPLQRLLESVSGKEGLIIIIWVIGIIIGGAIIFFCLKNGFRRSALNVLSIVALSAIFASQMSMPIERMHLIKYGILGWLGALDFAGLSLSKRISAVVLLGMVVAGTDESLQLFIPERVGDLRDVGFGMVGALVGGLLRRAVEKSGALSKDGHS